jgi:hypothetical protein
MRRLGWKAKPRKIIDGSSGMLVLLLAILSAFALKTALCRADTDRSHHANHGYIQMEGDIPYPGVYPLCFGCKGPAEIIEKTGLFLHGHHSPNMPDIEIQSGMKITIQRDGKEWRFHNEEMSAFYKCTLGIPISLNQESEEGLTAIPGIGPQLAKTIALERDKRGGFQDLNELISIKGIGPGLLRKIGDYVAF